MLMKRGTWPQINCLSHTLSKLQLNHCCLASTHSRNRQTGPYPGASWCKHVLDCIKIEEEEEEEENKEEAIVFCWRGFLLRTINAAKNKLTAGPDVFYLCRKKGKERQDRNHVRTRL